MFQIAHFYKQSLQLKYKDILLRHNKQQQRMQAGSPPPYVNQILNSFKALNERLDRMQSNSEDSRQRMNSKILGLKEEKGNSGKIMNSFQDKIECLQSKIESIFQLNKGVSQKFEGVHNFINSAQSNTKALQLRVDLAEKQVKTINNSLSGISNELKEIKGGFLQISKTTKQLLNIVKSNQNKINRIDENTNKAQKGLQKVGQFLQIHWNYLKIALHQKGLFIDLEKAQMAYAVQKSFEDFSKIQEQSAENQRQSNSDSEEKKSFVQNQKMMSSEYESEKEKGDSAQSDESQENFQDLKSVVMAVKRLKEEIKILKRVKVE